MLTTIGSFISPNESALVVGLIQLIGTFVVPVLTDRTGRKVSESQYVVSLLPIYFNFFLFQILYSFSTLGAAVGFSVLGSYMMLKEQKYPVESFNWIPLSCFCYIVFLQSLGVSTLSYTVSAEIMPEHLKEAGISTANIVLSISAFLVLKFMPTLSDALGFHITMYLFGAISIPCGLFIIFYVPETRGKSYQEIMKMLS